jgi:Type VI secretion system/phage-baseplate injector OB domain
VTGRFYGKYRGKVAANADPLQLGRVQVSCPAIFGDGQLAWALPCTPYGGPGVGFFAVPPVGADVWVEFEAGDPDYPIWAGCFWAAGQVPADPALPTTKMLKTDGLTLTVDDLPGGGGVTLTVSAPAVAVPMTISLTESGIEISTGGASVKLDPVSVSVNDGALKVI